MQEGSIQKQLKHNDCHWNYTKRSLFMKDGRTRGDFRNDVKSISPQLRGMKLFLVTIVHELNTYDQCPRIPDVRMQRA